MAPLDLADSPAHGEQVGARRMRKIGALAVLLIVGAPTLAMAKDTRFWNLTADTITSFQLSSAGRNDWGKNQTDNDPDHSVDHDERLKITDVKSGVYDAKFVDSKRRACTVEDLQIKEGAVFSIQEKQLTNCAK
jgi:hypothetical protein